MFSNILRGEDNFRDHLTQALALKLNFKTTQHANEKALQKLVKAKGSSDSLKQAVQARAAIYGESLDWIICGDFNFPNINWEDVPLGG